MNKTPKELMQEIFARIPVLTDSLIKKIPPAKRRLFIYAAGGLVFLAICLTMAALAMNRGTREEPAGAVVSGIPAEELFYPDEPDFLPALLLGREPRRPWTAGDLEPYWTDPKTGHEDEWREEVKKAIDTLMEGVQ